MLQEWGKEFKRVSPAGYLDVKANEERLGLWSLLLGPHGGHACLLQLHSEAATHSPRRKAERGWASCLQFRFLQFSHL